MIAPTSDTEVPAFWQSLGLPGLADLHVHFLPPRMLRQVWPQTTNGAPRTNSTGNHPGSPATGSPTTGSPTTGSPATAPWPAIYKWSDTERVEHLRAMGVRAFTALAYAQKPGMAADLNAWTLDFAARTPGCVPSATFFPEPGVSRYTRAAIEAGARVFKVRLDACDAHLDHPLLDAVWGVLTDTGIPVIVHIGPSPGGARGVHNGLEPFSAVLRRHPRLTAIVAHLGTPEYAEFVEMAEKYERVGLDTAMAFTRTLETVAPFPRAHLHRLLELGLRGKIVLGSAFPHLPYQYAEQLGVLATLDFGDPWLRAVCWHNAARLLGLD